MITINELTESPNAFIKAKQVQPAVLKVDNKYWINGSEEVYFVSIHGDEANAVIDCECKAGKLRKACYHAAAAFIARFEEVAAEAREKAAANTKRNFDFDFDYSAEITVEVANSRDMACLPDTAANRAIIDAWFDLPASRRPRLFADFAGF